MRVNLAFLVLALVLFIVGGWLYWQAGRKQRAAGLPAGQIISADTGGWRRAEQPLISQRRHLVGRPDYLVDAAEGLIPVEVKSTRLRGDDPYDSHKLQLAAYCLLIEETEARRPPYGILHYANATVRIPFDDALRHHLLDLLDQIQQAQTGGELARSHDDPLRCARCGFREACGTQVLT